MPIWLRKYTFESIREFYEKEKEAYEEAQRESKGIQVAKPNISNSAGNTPNYSTKISKK